jgi:hypothetical protein
MVTVTVGDLQATCRLKSESASRDTVTVTDSVTTVQGNLKSGPLQIHWWPLLGQCSRAPGRLAGSQDTVQNHCHCDGTVPWPLQCYIRVS